MKRTILTSAVLGTVLSGVTKAPDKSYDFWPADVTNVGRMFQSMEDHSDPVTLKVIGRVPKWLKGSFYRNGPGKYEFGNATYKHFFDPSAIVQQMEIRNEEIKYNSRYIQSRNYVENKAADFILYPEIGTWAEDWSVTHNPDGSLIDDEVEVGKNRCKYLGDHFPTDNADVSLLPVHGWLMAMTESSLFHLIDPVTLETKHSLDLLKAKNLPKNLGVMTITAHGHIDYDGTYWNMGAGLDLSTDMPHVVYFTYKIAGAGRSAENMWKDPIDPQEFMDSIEFIEHYGHNQHAMDMNVRYFHMFSGTDNYLVLPLNSVCIEAKLMMTGCMQGKDLISAMVYDEEKRGEFRIFDKREHKFLPGIWQAPSFLQVHMIQAFEDKDNKDLIHLDTLLAGDPNAINDFYYEDINKTGQGLIDRYNSALPIAKPVRYTFDLSKMNRPGHIDIEPQELVTTDKESEDWQNFFKGGMDFPVVNFDHYYGRPYNHFWAGGFGTILPDRIYHTELSTGKKWVWREEGYSPSEPFFTSNPMPIGEDDGVVLSLCSPISTERYDLRPFVVILDGRTLTELARAYLPETYTVGVTFHGIWIDSGVY